MIPWVWLHGWDGWEETYQMTYERSRQDMKRHRLWKDITCQTMKETYCVLPEISAVCCVPDMRRPLENNSISWLVILTSYAVMFELRWRMFLLYMRMWLLCFRSSLVVAKKMHLGTRDHHNRLPLRWMCVWPRVYIQAGFWDDASKNILSISESSSVGPMKSWQLLVTTNSRL